MPMFYYMECKSLSELRKRLQRQHSLMKYIWLLTRFLIISQKSAQVLLEGLLSLSKVLKKVTNWYEGPNPGQLAPTYVRVNGLVLPGRTKTKTKNPPNLASCFSFLSTFWNLYRWLTSF